MRIGNEKSASVYECARFIWPYNALRFLVTYGVSSALSRRFADFSLMWIGSRSPTTQTQVTFTLSN